ISRPDRQQSRQPRKLQSAVMNQEGCISGGDENDGVRDAIRDLVEKTTTGCPLPTLDGDKSVQEIAQQAHLNTKDGHESPEPRALVIIAIQKSIGRDGRKQDAGDGNDVWRNTPLG